jgi:uncharacterized RDD family membrane protein YckC
LLKLPFLWLKLKRRKDMDVKGMVRDAVDGTALPSARISLYIGGGELAVIPSDDKGEFALSREASYIGKILTCQVEKEQYQTKKVTHKIEQDEVRLEIKLLKKEVSPPPPPPPPTPKEIEVRFDVKDEKSNPLEGVNIILEVETEQVGTGHSDKAGLYEATLRSDLKGKTLNYEAKMKGYKLAKGEVKLGEVTTCHIVMKNINMDYAGFWKRFAAVIIDYLIIMALGLIIGVIVAFLYRTQIGRASINAYLLGQIIGILIGWIYYAVFESSAIQATLGKMALGIKVTDMNGNRIGFGKATGRHFGKIVSKMILMIGYLMVAFTEKKQGLHDMMAGCLVVNK